MQPITGSTERTAVKGYSIAETQGHFANIDHRRWDVKSDETMRFLHLNGPQFFTHAWVHRAGPISVLETDIRESIGSISAGTLIDDLTGRGVQHHQQHTAGPWALWPAVYPELADCK